MEMGNVKKSKCHPAKAGKDQKKKRKTRWVLKSADTGKFVSKKFASANPVSTYWQRLTRCQRSEIRGQRSDSRGQK
jgi:hypothetical protein